jgi:hypothetical protein
VDSRYDYFTLDSDQTDSGGTIPTLPGYGPNTRTIMVFRVAPSTPAPAYDLAALYAEFATTATHQGVFVRDQDPILVPQAGYNTAYNANFPSGANAYARIQDTSITFNPLDTTSSNLLSPNAVTINFQPKAIAELFENDYGRMQATLGVELPFTNGGNQTTIPYRVIDPVTENLNDNVTVSPVIAGDGTQLWKITHNGVDTHPIHFHLFNVQVINRVGWDGQIRPPEPNELGWKETVRMNPLEDIIVAMRPVSAKVPFGVPDSIHLLDPTMPVGSTVGFSPQNPDGTAANTTNQMYNFGWEYVWHCHILSHEEMDMMRPMQFNVARSLPVAPLLSRNVLGSGQVDLLWTDPTPANDPATWGNFSNEVGFRIERAPLISNVPGTYVPIGSALANSTTFSDTTTVPGVPYAYRVVLFNAAGEIASNEVTVVPLAPAAPTNLTATPQAGPQVSLSWIDNAFNETSFLIERAANGGAFTTLATTAANSGTGTVTYVDQTVLPGTTYTYRVSAVNADGTSAPTSTASASVPAVPATPTNLVATVQTGPQVGLSWTDNATNETGFVIQRSVNGGAFTQLATVAALAGTGTASYVDTTVVANNTYAYRVYAVNGVVASAVSNTASVSLLPPAPNAPTSLAATTQTGPTVSLSFRDNATTETGFVIQRSVNGGAFVQLATLAAARRTGTVNYVDSTVTAGNTYAYRVCALNGTVWSAYSNTATVSLPAATPPAPPSNFTATSTPTNGGKSAQITLNWLDNSNNETSFIIERSTDPNFTTVSSFTVAANGTTLTQSKLSRGVTYYYRIKARNAYGDSTWVLLTSISITT